MFLNDQETATDLLHYEAIAQTIVSLILNTPKAPMTIGVHGDWGAGKSSVLKMIEGELAGEDRVLCLWFNGWAFEGFEDAKIVVIETIVEELRRARPTSSKVAEAAKKVLKRIDWLKLVQKAGGYAFTVATGIPTFGQMNDFCDFVTSFASKVQAGVSASDFEEAAKKASEFIKETPSDSGNLSEHIHAFRNDFKILLESADIDQLVVIVDDLDRCLPKTAIATLEAIRMFLFVDHTAFIIGADEMMIEYAVREHFPDLPPSSGPVSYARNYLEKLIQVPFRIPALGAAETRIYVALLIAESVLGPTDARFVRLLSAAREDMKKPWASRGLDQRALEAALQGDVPQEIALAQTMSAHVTNILSEGTRGNPRQIKRFLNSMMLRQAIADARGFGAEIKRPVLAKIMLAERFKPEFYEQIARLAANHPEGKPEAMRVLETHVLPVRSSEKGESRKSVGKRDYKAANPAQPLPPEVVEWEKSDWVRGWAMIDPPLWDVDLRPYVFVTRDKRTSLGGFVTNSHLEQLVDVLMGSQMAVSGAAQEVEKLTGPDQEEVFEAVRGRILQEDNFKTKPKGVDGLVLLVKKHPVLQRRLLTFIRELPTEKSGAWAAASWGSCISDPATLTEYYSILEGWSGLDDNKALQKSAQGILKLVVGR